MIRLMVEFREYENHTNSSSGNELGVELELQPSIILCRVLKGRQRQQAILRWGRGLLIPRLQFKYRDRVPTSRQVCPGEHPPAY